MKEIRLVFIFGAIILMGWVGLTFMIQSGILTLRVQTLRLVTGDKSPRQLLVAYGEKSQVVNLKNGEVVVPDKLNLTTKILPEDLDIMDNHLHQRYRVLSIVGGGNDQEIKIYIAPVGEREFLE